VRVLLASANRERLPDPIFPLGLAYIAADEIGLLPAFSHQGSELPVCQQTAILNLVIKLSQRPVALGCALAGFDIECPLVLGAG